jgi:signal transduction histidine kinase
MNLKFSFKRAVSLATTIYGACFTLLISLGLLVLSHFNSLKNYNHQAVHAYTVISQITQAESLLKDAENGTRAFLITKDSVFLRPFLNTNRLLMPALDSLKKIVEDNSMQTKDYENALKLAMLQLRISDSLIKTSNVGGEGKDSLINALMLRSRNVMHSYRTVTKHMINIENDQLTYRKKQIGYYQSKLVNNFTLLFAAVMLIIIMLGAWAFIEFKKRVRYQTSLEENIIALNQYNAELEQIAFAASHDLQEPLRKIRIFSDRLRIINKNKPEDESSLMIEKINRSAIQLHGLIADLVDLANIVQSKRVFNPVSLQEILKKSELQFQNEIQISCFRIIAGDLPAVQGSAEQLLRLFNNLFSNSLAFKSTERSPVIIISSVKAKNTALKNLPQQSAYNEYYHIKFQDNGIGFDDSFREKLFMPFQRLHNHGKDEIKRKGMGLAICKRIMVNHNGWIDADGNEGKGAIIHLYFPVMNNDGK